MDIPLHALSLDRVEAGGGRFPDGVRHCKYAPSIIIAQAIRGHYEVVSPRGWCLAGEKECFLARPGEFLEITHLASKRGDMRARWLHIDCLVWGTQDLSAYLDLPLKATGDAGESLGQAIQAIRDFRGTPSMETSFAQLEAGWRVMGLLLKIAPPKRAGDAMQCPPHLRKALVYMRNNLSREMSPRELAAIAHLSLSHFHAQFRERMGTSPMAYLKRLRMERARQLLTTSDLPIYGIAEALGYKNPFHFSREFKKAASLPPDDFRRRYRW